MRIPEIVFIRGVGFMNEGSTVLEIQRCRDRRTDKRERERERVRERERERDR